MLGLLRNVISGGPHSDKHPHGPRRVIFNWLHRLNGYLLFGLATYTVYKGVTVFTVGSTKADASGTVFYQWVSARCERAKPTLAPHATATSLFNRGAFAAAVIKMAHCGPRCMVLVHALGASS